MHKGFNQNDLNLIRERINLLQRNHGIMTQLFKKYYKNKSYGEAFLYLFFSIELSLKFFIMGEMLIKEIKKIKRRKHSFYSFRYIKEVFKITEFSPLINIFSLLYGDNIRNDLLKIKKERDCIIHTISKKNLDEKRIEKQFQKFFLNISTAFSNYVGFTTKIIDRNLKIIGKLKV